MDEYMDGERLICCIIFIIFLSKLGGMLGWCICFWACDFN
jgi:hypothetical protein